MISSPHPNCDVKEPVLYGDEWSDYDSPYSYTYRPFPTVEKIHKKCMYSYDQIINMRIKLLQFDYRAAKRKGQPVDDKPKDHLLISTDNWDYGVRMEGEILLTKWSRYKTEHWSSDTFENIIRVRMGLPLNNEMIKQARSYEGDTNFLYNLAFMCHGDWTDKQKNFLARMLLEHRDVYLFALWHACTTGLFAGVPTKDIEKRSKKSRKNTMGIGDSLRDRDDPVDAQYYANAELSALNQKQHNEIVWLREALIKAAQRFDLLAMVNDTMYNGVKPSVGATEIRKALDRKS